MLQHGHSQTWCFLSFQGHLQWKTTMTRILSLSGVSNRSVASFLCLDDVAATGYATRYCTAARGKQPRLDLPADTAIDPEVRRPREPRLRSLPCVTWNWNSRSHTLLESCEEVKIGRIPLVDITSTRCPPDGRCYRITKLSSSTPQIDRFLCREQNGHKCLIGIGGRSSFFSRKCMTILNQEPSSNGGSIKESPISGTHSGLLSRRWDRPLFSDFSRRLRGLCRS